MALKAEAQDLKLELELRVLLTLAAVAVVAALHQEEPPKVAELEALE